MQAPETLVKREPGRLNKLLHDHVLQALLVLALFVNLALFVYLFVRLPSLTDSLPMHFDASGLPDVIDDKSGILKLPAIGLLAFAVNAVIGLWVHGRERAAAILLATGALFVQVLMWLEAINIAGGLI